MRWSDSIADLMNMSLSKLWEIVKIGKPGVLQSMGPETVGHNFSNEQQQCVYISISYIFKLKRIFFLLKVT